MTEDNTKSIEQESMSTTADFVNKIHVGKIKYVKIGVFKIKYVKTFLHLYMAACICVANAEHWLLFQTFSAHKSQLVGDLISDQRDPTEFEHKLAKLRQRS